ncbi:hypothetical protein ACFL27_15210 [candidate division CSSED10-310 bacterium]|uniref:Uncharacterized protein n=1 Tax=candidate division CSSED10-310 bacterium TaxID=2855610 RepID=A0ABV6YZD5_UNCC1
MEKKNKKKDRSIFQKEEEILIRSMSAFEESKKTMDLFLNNFQSISKSYKKLLRQVKHLTKMSDIQQKKLHTTQKELDAALKKSEALLLNVLPESVAHELKEQGTISRPFYSPISMVSPESQKN